MGGAGSPAAFPLLVRAAALVVVIAGLKAASAIVVPLLVAVFLAIIFAPMLLWLRERGVPSWLALSLVIVLVVLVASGVGTIVGTSINQLSRSLPEYESRLQQLLASVASAGERIGIEVSNQAVRDLLQPAAAMQFAASLLSGVGALLANASFILLLTIFMLLEAWSFPAKLEAALPQALGSQRSQQILVSVRRYLSIKTLTSLATGLVVMLGLLVLGVDFAALWGLLAFLLNYVPNIGSILASIPAIALALLQIGPLTAFLTATGYLIVNLAIGGVVEPRVMGRGLGLSTLVVFVSLVFWGWVLGVAGMLFAVPLTMTARVVLEADPETRWVAILLGPAGAVPEPAPAAAEAATKAE